MDETINKLVEELGYDSHKRNCSFWTNDFNLQGCTCGEDDIRQALETAYRKGKESIELDPTSLRAQQRVKGHRCVTCGTPMEKINDNTWATACEHGKGLRFSSG